MPTLDELLDLLSRSWNGGSGRDFWDYDGVSQDTLSFESYNYTFQQALQSLWGCTTLDELVIFMTHKLGYPIHILDLMGGAYFLEHPEQAGQITGIRYQDIDPYLIDYYQSNRYPRRHLFEKISACPNRQVIVSDVLSQDHWRQLHQVLPKVDLLVCRPVGLMDNERCIARTWNEKSDYAPFYHWLYQNILGLLKPDSIMISEVPDVYDDLEILSFLSKYDSSHSTQSTLFYAPEDHYRINGYKRRYIVVTCGIFKAQ
jgi:hypothetical protein